MNLSQDKRSQMAEVAANLMSGIFIVQAFVKP